MEKKSTCEKRALGLRTIIVYVLVLSLSGVPGLLPLAHGEISDASAPILRHTPIAPLTVGTTLKIHSVVQDESAIKWVNLRYRAVGDRDYEKVPMKRVLEGDYEAEVPITKDFDDGIEYYLEASDQFGNEGTDGSGEKPYLLEVREYPDVALTTRSVETPAQKPFYKKWWFWTVVGVLIAGAGAAAAGGGGGGGDAPASAGGDSGSVQVNW